MPAHTAMEILRAALMRASEYATRGVSLTDEGVGFLDAFGVRREALAGGRPVKVDVAAMRAAIASNELRAWNWRAPEGERTVKGLGSWMVAMENESVVALKPKKPKAPCLEAVFASEGDGVARLRSLYRNGGFDVVVNCEGEARAREFALALAAERNMLGLATSVNIAPEEAGYSDRDQDQRLLQFGPAVFDPPLASAGEAWAIEEVGSKAKARAESVSWNAGDSGVRVFVNSPSRFNRYASRLHGEQVQKALDERERPIVLIDVFLEKSVPVGRVAMSSSLKAASTAEETFDESPWKLFADRKEARKASRPSAPKTWHPTTEAVAEAFVAREAPRGYVSGKSVYFHGPVAFSVYDGNPIAALVDLPGKRTAIFYGRDKGIGGTMAGTVTSAQGDVQAAVRGKGFLEFHVDSLTDFLSWGDCELDRVVFRFRRDKNEADYPSGCKVDKRKLKAFFVRKLEEGEEALDEALKTGFATYKKSGAYLGLAKLAEDRDEMAALFGVALPGIGDAAEFRTLADEARKAADARQVELRQRRSAEASNPEPDESDGHAPGF